MPVFLLVKPLLELLAAFIKPIALVAIVVAAAQLMGIDVVGMAGGYIDQLMMGAARDALPF